MKASRAATATLLVVSLIEKTFPLSLEDTLCTPVAPICNSLTDAVVRLHEVIIIIRYIYCEI